MAQIRNTLKCIGCGLALAIAPAPGLAQTGAEPPLDNEPAAPAGTQQDVQFKDAAPYSSDAALSAHLGYAGPAREYVLEREKFRFLVPNGYSTNAGWGLLVWVSPSDMPRVPRDWEAELAKHRLLLISAYRAGNDRHALDRCRLALDATCNVARRFPIDPQRIYVGGFSGGGRIASVLGVCYADLFTGALCICGVDFYQPVLAAPGQYYPPSYKPGAGVLARAKQSGRFVLLTGESDMNRPNTKSTMENGFKASGFKNALYIEVPGMEHALPPTEVLGSALDYLDDQAAATPGKK
jgi:predicted esterase